jgi:glutamate/aspartate transport system substrate-binding protein
MTSRKFQGQVFGLRQYSPCALACLALNAVTPAHAGPSLDRIKQTETITFAYRDAASPFSYADGKSKPMGYAIDLCQKLADAVATKLQVKHLATKYLSVTASNRVAAIAEGKADFECGSTTNTAERRDKVAFTVPHYITGARYAVRADSPVSELVDFGGKTLVSTTGTTPLKAAQQKNADGLLNIQISEVPDHVRGIEMVESGKAAGFAMDEVLLYGLIASRPDPAKLKVVGKYLTFEPLAIMLPKNDPELKKIADDEMKRLIRSGEATVLHDKWFLKPIAPTGRAINLPMNYLLRDFWKYPTDWVPSY